MKDNMKILILGAGTMGQQIGTLCALHGYEVRLYDLSMEHLEKSMERLRRNAGRVAQFNGFAKEQIPGALARISLFDNISFAAAGIDLVSESLPEDPELKGKVFGELNRYCPESTVFTTNTSSLLPSQFAEKTGRPDRLCALHFHDLSLSRVADVMPHDGTSASTLEAVRRFAGSIGQVAIELRREHNGYVFNNMLMSLLGSALSLASAGVASVEDIDRSWMGVMYTPVGPFGIMDSIGIETVWKITDYWSREKGGHREKENARFLKGYLDKGKLGLKTSEGFYTYPDPEFGKPGFLTASR